MNNSELVQSYRQQIGNVVNQANLQLFWNMYNRCGRGVQARDPSVQPPSPPAQGRRQMGHTVPRVQMSRVSLREESLPGQGHPREGHGEATSFLLLPGHGRRGNPTPTP